MQNGKDSIESAEQLVIWADFEIINITFGTLESSIPQTDEKLSEKRMNLW